MTEPPITFEQIWDAGQGALFEAARRLPSIEMAGPDDVQVGVVVGPAEPGGATGDDRPPEVLLDGIAAMPWIRSVVALTRVRATVPLPQLTGLFVLDQPGYELNDATYANLPGLEQLRTPLATPESLARLPRLRDLAFDWRTRRLPDGDRGPVEPSAAEIAAFPRVSEGAPALAGLAPGLERLAIPGFHWKDRVDPITGFERLRWLALNGWRNHRALGALTSLERLSLMEIETTSLRPLRRLDRLRELRLMGRLGSLDGIEAMGALETVWLRGRVVRDLEPLTSLPALADLTLFYPDAVEDFTPIGRMASLRRLELVLGSSTDSGSLPTVDFLGGLDRLEELRLANVDIGDRRLDPLFALPRLRSVLLTGTPGPNVDEFRARRPDVELTVHLVGDPAGAVWVGPVRYAPLGDGSWFLLQDLAGAVGAATNHDAEGRIRAEIRRRDAALAGRLTWDSESGAVGVSAASEADIRAMAEAARDLAERARG